MMGKLMLLLVLYGGLSIAALLLVLIGFALARTRLEATVMAAISGVLLLVHCAELYFLWDLGRLLSGDGRDPLVAAGAALVLAAAVATTLLARKRFPASVSGDMR